jgi:hypothetical protein
MTRNCASLGGGRENESKKERKSRILLKIPTKKDDRWPVTVEAKEKDISFLF